MRDPMNMSTETEAKAVSTAPDEIGGNVFSELESIGGTELVRRYQKDINVVTGNLAEENRDTMEEDGEQIDKEKKEKFSRRRIFSLFGIGLTSATLGYIISQTSCTTAPITSVVSMPESVVATSVAQTLQSNEIPLEVATATPLVESTAIVEPTATEEGEYMEIDFGITPEEFNNLVGSDEFLVIKNMYEPENYNVQYQVWYIGEVYKLARKSVYVSELREGESISKVMGLDIDSREDDLEKKVFDAVMESQCFMKGEFLGESLQDVHATVVYMIKEGDRYIYYSLNDSGIAIYIQDGYVVVFFGNEIPNYLPEEVKAKYRDGFSRVELNNGKVEAFGKRIAE